MDSENESYHTESEFYYPDEDFWHFMYQSVSAHPHPRAFDFYQKQML